MNTESREHLSSFMDGEEDPEAGRFLVRRLGADADLRHAWARYHLIRDCMRHQDGHITRTDLSVRVSAALSTDPAKPAGAPVSRNWLKPVAGMALAASVALIAVVMVSNVNSPSVAPDAVELSETPVTESFATPNIHSMTPDSQPVNLSGRSPQENSKMNAYLLQHYQLTGESGGRGFVSFVPIVVTRMPAPTEVAVEFGDKDSEPSRQ